MYGGDEYSTGDDIADAVLAYGRALGEEGRADLVEVPVREADGRIVSVTFLIGPASQIAAKSSTGGGAEVEDQALVERLRTLTRGVESPTAVELELPTGVIDDIP